MKFTISKGTMRFLLDLLYFSARRSQYKTYAEMLKYLEDGYYED